MIELYHNKEHGEFTEAIILNINSFHIFYNGKLRLILGKAFIDYNMKINHFKRGETYSWKRLEASLKLNDFIDIKDAAFDLDLKYNMLYDVLYLKYGTSGKRISNDFKFDFNIDLLEKRIKTAFSVGAFL